MSLTVILGQIDPTVTFAVEQFAMPLLTDLPGISLASEVLTRATDQRVGHVLVGPPGVGKSIAVECARARFEAHEQDLLTRYPERHRLRRLLVVETIRAKTPRALLITLIMATQSPGETPFTARRHGTYMDEDQLLNELVRRLLKYRYSGIIVEEAETLPGRALQQFRDVISKAKARDPERIRAAKGVQGTSRGGPQDGAQEIGAGGVGVMLVGTEAVEKAVLATSDAGQRWATITRVDAQPPEVIPGLYVRVFPRFAEHVDAVGEDAWTAFVDAHVTRGRALTLRLIENHCWRYFAIVVNGTAGKPDAVHARDRAFFNRKAFLHALTATDFDTVIDGERARRAAARPARGGGR